MAKLEKKYKYEIRIKKLRENVNKLQKLYSLVKEDFIHIELRMQKINEIVKELNDYEFDVEIIPVKEEKKKEEFNLWINRIKNKLHL